MLGSHDSVTNGWTTSMEKKGKMIMYNLCSEGVATCILYQDEISSERMYTTRTLMVLWSGRILSQLLLIITDTLSLSQSHGLLADAASYWLLWKIGSSVQYYFTPYNSNHSDEQTIRQQHNKATQIRNYNGGIPPTLTPPPNIDIWKVYLFIYLFITAFLQSPSD